MRKCSSVRGRKMTLIPSASSRGRKRDQRGVSAQSTPMKTASIPRPATKAAKRSASSIETATGKRLGNAGERRDQLKPFGLRGQGSLPLGASHHIVARYADDQTLALGGGGAQIAQMPYMQLVERPRSVAGPPAMPRRIRSCRQVHRRSVPSG